jgi:micrococcal nuclease
MVPKSYFDEEKSVYGLVERVTDGDTIRVRHLPLYSFRFWGKQPAPLTQRGIAQETMSIRLYGIDCPELAKRGHKAQKGSDEAKQFVKELLEHRVVRITFLRRDQFARAVAAVEILPPWGACFRWIPSLGRRDVSIILAKEGMAELYTGGGAEYWVRHTIRLFSACLVVQTDRLFT